MPEPVPEPVAEAITDTAPSALAEPEPVSDSSFALLDGRFDPLGVAELKPLGDAPVEMHRSAPASHGLVDADDVIDAVDAIDVDLFPIFDEEAEELLPQLASRLRDWVKKPGDAAHPAACMRTLHTLKGGARLAGAMRLGEMAHRLETRIERLLAEPPINAVDVETLQVHGDALAHTLDVLRAGGTSDESLLTADTFDVPAPTAAPTAPPVMPELAVLLDTAPPEAVESAAAPLGVSPDELLLQPGRLDAVASEHAALAGATEPAELAEPTAATNGLAEIDWSRFAGTDGVVARKPAERSQATQSAVRVRAPLLDRLVNQAGEVSITRSRIETGVGQIKTSLSDLTENLERLRAQLRDIEFHGEVQMTSRLEAAKAASQSFDPLEFDRFTRFQELTRMMAESVNDVGTVQRALQRSLEVTEDELVAQARMTRDLQDDLLRTRMVEFEGLSDRLYRVVRQAAKETGKSVRLDIVGGSIEVDRGVLDRMTGSFEHLLRNCVSHGIETPDVRTNAGKDPTGSIIVALSQEANEVGVEFRDDGAGLNLARIRAKGEALGLIAPDAQPSDAELANLIFSSGFSTADQITELSGRGVGMDVVRSEVNAMGGRVETATAAGQGTSFKLILPLTTAVTQVVMLRCGDTQVAVPSTLVEIVRRASPAEIDAAYASASYTLADRQLQFFWLGALLQISARPAESHARTRTVVVIRSAQQRVALHVDEVLGNQEVVVKQMGPQLSRLPGLAGITLLASGTVALIYNPVALATLYGEAARAATHAAMHSAPGAKAVVPTMSAPEVIEAPLVMVVDDSLTVRRVTQRLLLREGYRVVLAKDGLDALERLAEAIPAIVLSDIEMPRMDGFDLVRNMRADARLRELPVIMITSRIAQKHRDYAAELGVDHYLGKPYSEEDLLALIARYTRNRVAA
jgi:chemosensory pili system protein ChpA (sensor histidine kinase/response regulator)